MITRSDLNEESFERLIREELIDQLACLEMDGIDERPEEIIRAFNIVIAYNSVPGTYKDGEFDY